jgi:Cytochrome c554 and c-prime
MPNNRTHSARSRLPLLGICVIAAAGLLGSACWWIGVFDADPTVQQANRLRAEQAALQGDWAESLAAVAKLRQPTGADVKLRAVALSNLRRFSEAARAWHELRKRQPRANDDLRQLFVEWQQSTRGNDIFDLSQQIMLRADDGYPVAHAMLALFAKRGGQYQKAAEHFGELHRQLKTSERGRLDFAEALLRTGRPEQVSAVLKGVESAEAYWLLSRAALQRADAESARSHLEIMQQIEPRTRDLIGTREEPAPLVGSAACAQCHTAQFDAQASTHHANTFRPIRASDVQSLLDVEWIADPLDSQVEHRLEEKRGNVVARTRNLQGDEVRSQWLYRMGSGKNGETFISKRPTGEFLEYRLSLYTGLGWDVTTGQGAGKSLLEHAGKRLHQLEFDVCIRCHTTDTESARALPERAKTSELGVRCESCHGPGKHHLLAVRMGMHEDLAIRNPARLAARELVAVCASCHQPDAPLDVEDPTNARFQTATFRTSRCFRESDTLSCVTCHDPHSNARTDAAYYDQKCMTCHTSDRVLPCPSHPGNNSCTGCHMPRVSGSMRHTTFSDHSIPVKSRRPPL